MQDNDKTTWQKKQRYKVHRCSALGHTHATGTWSRAAVVIRSWDLRAGDLRWFSPLLLLSPPPVVSVVWWLRLLLLLLLLALLYCC